MYFTPFEIISITVVISISIGILIGAKLENYYYHESIKGDDTHEQNGY